MNKVEVNIKFLENLKNEKIEITGDNLNADYTAYNEAVKKAILGKHFVFDGKVIVIAIGKAAWNMAKAAAEHAVTSRTNKANWNQLEIISSNGSQMWFWDGHTAYDFYVN